MSPTPTATIFDIQRFSIHDGPGIRTVIFFKGCALNCTWCQNPEGLTAPPELAYYEDRCVDTCAACVPVCEERALRLARTARVDFSRCTDCGECVDVCPADALHMVGREMGVREVLDAVARDRSFYASSGGGITLSGGEPVLQTTFLQAFLPAAKAAGHHITLETAGHYAFEALEPLLLHLDLILFDVKLADPALHQTLTGQDNGQIRANLQRLLQGDTPVVVRMPIVPGVNTTAEESSRIAHLLAELEVTILTLLPYNALWEAKLPRLRWPRSRLELAPLGRHDLDALCARLAGAGITAQVVGEEAQEEPAAVA